MYIQYRETEIEKSSLLTPSEDFIEPWGFAFRNFGH